MDIVLNRSILALHILLDVVVQSESLQTAAPEDTSRNWTSKAHELAHQPNKSASKPHPRVCSNTNDDAQPT